MSQEVIDNIGTIYSCAERFATYNTDGWSATITGFRNFFPKNGILHSITIRGGHISTGTFFTRWAHLRGTGSTPTIIERQIGADSATTMTQVYGSAQSDPVTAIQYNDYILEFDDLEVQTGDGFIFQPRTNTTGHFFYNRQVTTNGGCTGYGSNVGTGVNYGSGNWFLSSTAFNTGNTLPGSPTTLRTPHCRILWTPEKTSHGNASSDKWRNAGDPETIDLTGFYPVQGGWVDDNHVWYDSFVEGSYKVSKFYNPLTQQVRYRFDD